MSAPTPPLDPRFFVNEADAGRELYRVRPWPSNGGWVVVAAVTLVGFLLLWGPLGAGGALAAAVGLLLVLLALALAPALDSHRVCERALLLGVTWPRGRSYVVPLVSIEPSQVRLHHRANFIARRLRAQGQPALGSPVQRLGPLCTVAVSLPGLVPGLASPRRRDRVAGLLASAGGGPLFTPVQGEYEPAGRAPANLPVTTWVLGVRRPRGLLEALEAALVAAGRLDARGLAERELRSPQVEHWRPSASA